MKYALEDSGFHDQLLKEYELAEIKDLRLVQQIKKV